MDHFSHFSFASIITSKKQKKKRTRLRNFFCGRSSWSADCTLWPTQATGQLIFSSAFEIAVLHRQAGPNPPFSTASQKGDSNSSSDNQITRLLRAWSNGDREALEKLTPLIYQDLYRIARTYMGREQPGHILQNTALIGEVYVQLARMKGVEWHDRSHFFAVCARLMRHILINHARSRLYLKRGGEAQHVSLGDDLQLSQTRSLDLVALDDALQTLAALDPRKSQVVELRFFGGFSVEETAEILRISEKTVRRDWRFTQLWLSRELDRGNKRAT